MRHLPESLKKYFEDKIPSVPNITPVDLFVSAALSCEGVTEVGKDNCGPLVELFQSAVSRPQGQSWCLDFVQACLAYAELKSGIQSPLPTTESCLDLWNRSKNYQSRPQPEHGDLILWQFKDTYHGHVGIFLWEDGPLYKTIEGNTGPSHEIDANGDGVYVKDRIKGGSATFHPLGFLRPFP